MYIGQQVMYPLFVSDVKKIYIFSTFFQKKNCSIKFHEILSTGSRVLPCGLIDWLCWESLFTILGTGLRIFWRKSVLPCMHPSLPPLRHRSSPDAACNRTPVESAAVAFGTAVVIWQAHRLPAMSCTVVGFDGISWIFKAHIVGRIVMPCLSITCSTT